MLYKLFSIIGVINFHTGGLYDFIINVCKTISDHHMEGAREVQRLKVFSNLLWALIFSAMLN